VLDVFRAFRGEGGIERDFLAAHAATGGGRVTCIHGGTPPLTDEDGECRRRHWLREQEALSCVAARVGYALACFIFRFLRRPQEQGLPPGEIELSLRGAGVAMEAPGTTNLLPPTNQPQSIEYVGKILSLAGEIALRLQTKRQDETDQNSKRIWASLDRQTAALERQNALLERQNELLEGLTRAGVTLPGEYPSNSRQEAPGEPEGGKAIEPDTAAPENASEGLSRPSWWQRLWRREG